MTDADVVLAARAAARGAARVIRDPELRRDAAQRAYVALATRAAWRGESALPTWAYRVGMNSARELLRRESRHLRCEALDGMPRVAATAAAPALTPEQRLERGERIRDLWLAITTLPEASRASLEASMMGVPAVNEADKSRRFRGMARVRRYLQARGWTC